MSKAFDTINIHTLIRKLLHTRSSGTIMKLTQSLHNIQKPHIHTKSVQTGIPQGGVLSPTLFNIYTAALPPPRAPVLVMYYADDITVTSTQTDTSTTKKYIQPYIHKVVAWTNITSLHYIQTKQLSRCSLQTLRNIRAI